MASSDNTMKSPLHQFIIRLFLNQVTVSVIGFFGVTVVVSLVLNEDSTLENTIPYLLICSLIVLLLLAIISYSLSWRVGQRDYNLVKYNHIRLDMLRGIKAGLIAQAPCFVFGVIATVLYYAGFETLYLWLKIIYFPFWWLFQLNDRPYMFLITLVFVPFMTNWGYRYGYSFISLRQKIMYQDPNKDKKKKSDDKRLR